MFAHVCERVCVCVSYFLNTEYPNSHPTGKVVLFLGSENNFKGLFANLDLLFLEGIFFLVGVKVGFRLGG